MKDLITTNYTELYIIKLFFLLNSMSCYMNEIVTMFCLKSVTRRRRNKEKGKVGARENSSSASYLLTEGVTTSSCEKNSFVPISRAAEDGRSGEKSVRKRKGRTGRTGGGAKGK